MAGSESETHTATKTVLATDKVTKRFGELIANDGVDFDLRAGEIHAILGENGAGKTTLCNILYGLLRPDSGRVTLAGREVRFRSPREAMEAGIGMVHQELTLVSPMTVAENVSLMMDSGFGLLNLRKTEKRIGEISKQYGLWVKSRSRIKDLSVGERQRVEIIKALMKGANILILDEPTSFLTRIESSELFKSLSQMAASGKSIVFVSHKIDEVRALSDRVTVLRHGKVVATALTSQATKQELARMIVGRDILFSVTKSSSLMGDIILQLKEVSALGDAGLPALEKVSLTVRRGEIVGIAGVAGNGQRELVEVICGLRKPTDGKIHLLGMDFSGVSSLQARGMGVAHIPEDQKVGLVFDFNLSDNLVMLPHVARTFARRIPILGQLLNRGAVKDQLRKLISEYDIRVPGEDVPTWTLSGGTKQKLILSRELFWNPKLIVANNPTKGLDVAATEYVRNVLVKEKERGKGVLLVSTDLDEILDMSDRIAVMTNGRIAAIFERHEANLEMIATLMTMSRSA